MRDRLLSLTANVVWRWPVLIVIAAAVLAGICAWYASSNLILNANTDDLVARDRPYMIEYRRLLEEFGDLEHIYVVVENVDPVTTQTVVDAITARLRAMPELPAVHCAVEPHEQLRLATRAMPEPELEDFVIASGAFPALVTGNADRVIREANEAAKHLIQTASQLDEQQQRRDGAAAVFLAKAVAAGYEHSASRSDMQFLMEPPAREYFRSETGRFYFIDVTPSKNYSTLSVVEEPLRKIRAAVENVRREFPGVTIGLTGKPVLQADEMATSNADMTKASLLAFVLCAALFMLSFGGFWKPVLAVIAFACASAWTYGFATLAVGQLNLLSIVFMLVLIGVGFDYGVHVLTRYREFRSLLDVRQSMTQAVVAAGRGNITGAMTSAAVFFLALLASFQGLRELGLIAGAGLLLCVLAMIVVLPALLTIVERSRHQKAIPLERRLQAERRELHASKIDTMFNALINHPLPVLAVAVLLSLGLIMAPGVWRFEHNLLELQARGLESVQWEQRILDDSAAASWFGAVIADSQDEALNAIARASQYKSIGAIRSVFDMIAPQSQARDELRAQLPSITPRIDAEDGTASGPAWNSDDLRNIANASNLMAFGARQQAPADAHELKQLSDDLKSLVSELEGDSTNAAAARARIDGAIASIGKSLHTMLEGNSLDVRAALPEALRDQYMSPAGRYLIMLHPRENVWELESMQRFVSDLRSIDPKVTGAPISHLESLIDMQQAFLIMALLSAAVIAVLLWIDFGNIKWALVALIPTMFGLIWLFEIMALLGISFNLANFFSVPILIGLSVDGSVHVLHRYLEHPQRKVELGSTRTAVIVTALTTTIGFGCLMLAHHRGLRSLGQVMAIGSIVCLIASIIVLPAVLTLLGRAKAERARLPA